MLVATVLARPVRAEPIPLPSSDQVITPAPPPALVVPPDAPLAPTLRDPLTVPTEALEVRIQASQGLSLQEAMQRAVEHNVQVRQAELGVASAQAALDQALAAYAVTATSGINYSYSQSAFAPSDSSLLTITLVQLGYLLLDGGGRDAAVTAAQEGVRIAELTLAQTLQEVRLQVANAYYALQSADANVAVRAAAVTNAEASLRDAQAQERAGISTRFEVLQAETSLANNRQQLLRAQNEQRLARRALASLLNYALPTDVTATDAILPGPNWELSLEASIIRAYAERPELEILRRQVSQANAQAIVALNRTAPELRLGASLTTGDNLQTAESWRLGYSFSASLSYAWGDGGAAQAAARQARISAETFTSRFDQTVAGIRQEVEEAYLSLESAREQIEAARTAVTTATESLRLARLRFQAGVGTQTEVLSAEAALTEAQGNFSGAIVAYNRSLARLQRALGTL
ncbi:MAG: TolC family protein [Thermostichales cyanobacterium SRBZ-1_bins_19]